MGATCDCQVCECYVVLEDDLDGPNATVCIDCVCEVHNERLRD